MGFAAAAANAQVAPLSQLGRDTVPSQMYFRAIDELFEGEYRDAERLFRLEVKGAIKIGVTQRWIDSICYHAMLGETYYHQGRPELALEQFNYACTMFLEHPKWMLLVKFDPSIRPDQNRLRRPLPWGQSKRQFTLGDFPTQMLIQVGDMESAARAIQGGGGVVTGAQYWQVNVIEIVRATALAIRRRNELLGPLGEHDAISRDLVNKLSRGGAPPNHYSNAWINLQLGLAQIGIGDEDQARANLQRAERIAGKFDHPLTSVALLELGKLAMKVGQTEQAGQLFAEASYSAYYFENPLVIDEAFRWGAINELAESPTSVNSIFAAASNWAQRERYYHIVARLQFAIAEALMNRGELRDAERALQLGQSRMKDARTGRLGNWGQFLAGRLLLQQNNAAGEKTVNQAIADHIGMSNHNLQLILANQRFDQQQIRDRTATALYAKLLNDPEPEDWVLAPLETLAKLKTPQADAFLRWLDAAAARKDTALELEITDLAKRHRYNRNLSWGGRLASLRDTLDTPAYLLSVNARNQRNELLLRFPEYEALQGEGEQLEAELRDAWKTGIDISEDRVLVRTWREWQKNLQQREAMLHQIGVQRVTTDLTFPPRIATTEMQSRLQPGEGVLVYHQVGNELIGYLVSARATTNWSCGPTSRVGGHLAKFLQDLGNYDGNYELSAEMIQSDDWQESGKKLFDALLSGSSIDPESMTKLVVIPDGLTWYVPWAALPITTEDRTAPLVSFSQLRVAPTLGLAFNHVAPERRLQRTAIVGLETMPGKSEAEQREMLAELKSEMKGLVQIPTPPPVPTPLMAALLEQLVVLDSFELDLSAPLDWTPIPGSRSERESSLNHWLTLPQTGPQMMLFPGSRTIAERGGKGSRRRDAAPPGTELFVASCGLMSSGASTILLSNWNVGGVSTQELLREFLQELPHTSTTAAWQRSVQLAMETTIDPSLEPRVKSGKDDPLLTSKHPFFWGGYLLIDSGSEPESEDEPDAATASPDEQQALR